MTPKIPAAPARTKPGGPAPCLGSALKLAGLGWPVLPLHASDPAGCSCGRRACPSPGAHPRLPGWRARGSARPDVVRGWWAQWPDSNLGLDLARAGLVAVELTAAARDLSLAAGDFPATGGEILAPDGTLVLLYRRPAGFPLRDAAAGRSPAGAAFVCRSAGVVVLPPSVAWAAKAVRA